MGQFGTWVLYFFIGGFTSGVLWRSFFDFGYAFPFFLLLLAGSIFIFFFLWKEKRMLFVSLVLFTVALGIVRFDVADQDRGHPLLDARVKAQVLLGGIIIDEPDERDGSVKYVFKSSEYDEKILITADLYSKLSYGDEVVVSGVLQKPENFESENGKVFDYVSFLSKDGIHYQLFFPEIEKVGEGKGNPIKSVLFSLKEKFLKNIKRVIPDPEAALLGGLVVGAKQSLGSELQDDFRKTGIIHIVVLSGYNMTIVANTILKSLFFVPQTAAISLGAVAIVLFAIMTGASATIVRASIMALLVLLARATGRTYAINRALFIAGFFMVLHNPKILAFDPSFQLSFLATLGLIHVSPLIEKKVLFIPEKYGIREVVIATISTQIFVLPFILYLMGEFSLVALPVNLLILFFVPVTMLFGFLTGVVGFVSTILSLPFAWIAHALLSYELWVVDIFAKLPFSSFEIGQFPLLLALFVYFIYTFVLIRAASR
ncbi:MAG: ComEC/Rec2 family competence protein [Candidatus Paceibacterota bacterium]